MKTQEEIEQEEILSFKKLSPLLTPTQKKIYRYIHWFCRTYYTAFPSHARIAEKCKCCRDTVIQAIKKFCALGWLGTIKRAFKSCIYVVGECLLGLDLSDPKTFKRPSPTRDPTLLKEYNSNTRNVRSENVQNSQKQAQNEISNEVDCLPLSHRDKKNALKVLWACFKPGNRGHKELCENIPGAESGGFYHSKSQALC